MMAYYIKGSIRTSIIYKYEFARIFSFSKQRQADLKKGPTFSASLKHGMIKEKSMIALSLEPLKRIQCITVLFRKEILKHSVTKR